MTTKKTMRGRHKAARRRKHRPIDAAGPMTLELFTALTLRAIKRYGPALKDLSDL